MAQRCAYQSSAGRKCGKPPAPGARYCMQLHLCPAAGCIEFKSSQVALCPKCVKQRGGTAPPPSGRPTPSPTASSSGTRRPSKDAVPARGHGGGDPRLQHPKGSGMVLAPRSAHSPRSEATDSAGVRSDRMSPPSASSASRGAQNQPSGAHNQPRSRASSASGEYNSRRNSGSSGMPRMQRPSAGAAGAGDRAEGGGGRQQRHQHPQQQQQQQHPGTGGRTAVGADTIGIKGRVDRRNAPPVASGGNHTQMHQARSRTNSASGPVRQGGTSSGTGSAVLSTQVVKEPALGTVVNAGMYEYLRRVHTSAYEHST